MTAREGREEGHPDQQDPGRLDNGLRAPTYVPLTDVDPAVGQHLLTALGRARIAAYLGPTAAPDEQRRLFVASEERGDARTIVASAVRALGAAGAELVDEPAEGPEPAPRPDLLDGRDTDALFDALVADWHVDTHNAIRDAERDLSREDAEWRARLSQPPVEDPVWLDEDHYVPPPPPPLPRLSGPAVLAVCVIVVSILMLGMGTQLGFSTEFTMVLGVGGLLLAAGILLSRLRDHDRDEDDDGAAI